MNLRHKINILFEASNNNLICATSGLDKYYMTNHLFNRVGFPFEIKKHLFSFIPMIDFVYNVKLFQYNHNEGKFFNEISIGEFKNIDSYFEFKSNIKFYNKLIFLDDFVDIDIIIYLNEYKCEWRQLWRLPINKIQNSRDMDLSEFVYKYSYNQKPFNIKQLFKHIWINYIYYLLILHLYFN